MDAYAFPHVPSNQCSSGKSAENQECSSHPVSTHVAHENVVPGPSGSSDRPAKDATKRRLTSDTESVKAKVYSRKPYVVSTARLEVIQLLNRTQGISDEVSIISSKKLAESTLKIYDYHWKEYKCWCDHGDYHPLHPTLPIMHKYILFLSQEKNLNPVTIRNKISALNPILVVSTGISFSTEKSVIDLLKGLAREHSKLLVKRPKVPEWHLSYVLDSLRHAPYEPASMATLEDQGKKTLFLLALASGRRVSEVHALSFSSHQTEFLNEGMEVRLRTNVHFRAKNQKIGEKPVDIVIPSLKTITRDKLDLTLCPVRALLWYKEISGKYRGNQQAMFICHGKGKRTTGANTRTLARWFKEVVSLACDEYPKSLEGKQSANIHQLRAIGNSMAFATGSSIAEVMQAGYWKNPNTFISCYLLDMTTQLDKIYKLGNIVAGQKII